MQISLGAFFCLPLLVILSSGTLLGWLGGESSSVRTAEQIGFQSGAQAAILGP